MDQLCSNSQLRDAPTQKVVLKAIFKDAYWGDVHPKNPVPETFLEGVEKSLSSLALSRMCQGTATEVLSIYI